MTTAVEISTMQGVRDLLKLLTVNNDITLTEASVPIAKLTPIIQPKTRERKPNLHSGLWIREDFDHYLPREFWADLV